MKKTLVALAAASAVSAFAQSSVAIVGVIDAGYKTVAHNMNPLAQFSGVSQNGNSTSQFDFIGTEDLGGGLKASFFNELDFSPIISNTANQQSSTASFNGQVFNGTPFTGQQYVALASPSFGSVKIGTPDSSLLYTGLTMSPFGTNLGGGWSSGFGRMGTSKVSGASQYVGAEGSTGRVIRFQKTINYTTPVMNGLTANVEYSVQNANGQYGANENGVLGFDLKYSNGPLNVAVNSTKASSGAIAAAGSIGNTLSATSVANNLAANASVVWNAIGANYKLTNSTTIYAGYTSTKSNNLTTAGYPEDSKSYNVAGKYTMGNIDFLGNFLVRKSGLTEAQVFCETAVTASSSNNNQSCTATGNGTISNGAYNAKQTLIGLGANYNLSKNTFVYYRYERISGLNANATTTTVGIASIPTFGDATQTANMVGVKMS